MARMRRFDLPVYVAVRLAVVAFQLMPLSFGLALARVGAWLAYHLDKRHRLVAAENLRHAFPQKGEAEIDRIVRASYLHLFSIAVETAVLMRRMNRRNVTDYVQNASDEDDRIAWEFAREDRACIILTGHLGNWEALNRAKALQGAKAAVIARKLDNPYLDSWIRRLRRVDGIRIVNKDGAADEAAAVLEARENLGIVGDQDAGPKGLFVDFLGRPASTFKSIALLSMTYRAPILVLACVRNGRPPYYQLSLEDVILPEDYANDPGAVRAITQRYTAALERVVRRHPEQYFWVHRRWKSQPRVRAVSRAASRAA